MTTEAPARIYKAAAPTVAFNAPVPQMDIPEKSYVIGANSGKIHAVIGDNPAGPETVTVTPPGGMPRRARIGGMATTGATPAGAVSMAGGGEMEVGPDGRTRAQVTGTDYMSDAERAWFLGQSTNIDAGAQQFLNQYNNGQQQEQPQQPPPVVVPAWNGYIPTDPLEAQRRAEQAAIDARAPIATATGAQINANAGVVSAQGNQIAANQNVVNTVSGMFAPRGAQIGAQGEVINAQGQLTEAQRAQIQQAQQQNAARMAEETAVQAASRNTADQAAVARAQNTRANEDYKYGLAGLTTPVEVATANGADSSNLPPGTRAKLQTQEQLLSTKQGQNERLRAIQQEQAQNIVKLAATDVDAAQQAAARVGLTVAQAQLLVDEAQNAAAQAGIGVDTARNTAAAAGLDVDRANLSAYNAATAVQQSQLPPEGMAGYVIYTNPTTGQSNYMTPAAAASLKFQDQQMIDRINEGQYSGLSPSSITSLFYNGLITGTSTIDEPHALQALTGMLNGNQVAAQVLLDDAKARANAQMTSDPKNVAAMQIFNKPYSQLTIDQKADPRLIDAILAAQGIT